MKLPNVSKSPAAFEGGLGSRLFQPNALSIERPFQPKQSQRATFLTILVFQEGIAKVGVFHPLANS